jgi:1-acyl-sn-glycerol-3-phosphate acyltransferase
MGSIILATKHQSFQDAIASSTEVDDPLYIFKRDLAKISFVS